MSASANYQGPGRYRHYKGGEYEVLGIALQENTIDKEGGSMTDAKFFVIYRPLSPGSLLPMGTVGGLVELWARELSDFNEMVTREPFREQVPRFTKTDAGV